MSAPVDYIVVGAGSAGCVVAARLSERPDCRVVLLEAGGSHDDFRIRTPGMSGALWRSKFDWGFSTVPQLHLGGRTPHWPRGKLLGGTSSLNYMVYMRGHRDNYDSWRDEGNAGWGYGDVLHTSRSPSTTSVALTSTTGIAAHSTFGRFPNPLRFARCSAKPRQKSVTYRLPKTSTARTRRARVRTKSPVEMDSVAAAPSRFSTLRVTAKTSRS